MTAYTIAEARIVAALEYLSFEIDPARAIALARRQLQQARLTLSAMHTEEHRRLSDVPSGVDRPGGQATADGTFTGLFSEPSRTRSHGDVARSPSRKTERGAA